MSNPHLRYPRDLIGYGGAPPDPKWPNGARLALNFVLNYEEWSEYSVPDGDGFSEAMALNSIWAIACINAALAVRSPPALRLGMWRGASNSGRAGRAGWSGGVSVPTSMPPFRQAAAA